jgi:3-oxoacyl-(acyl-carrier-protein) synthase
MESFGALCTKYNDKPDKASRPLDKDRAGTVVSDGGGVLILESLESA